jgi:hypothetical protein
VPRALLAGDDDGRTPRLRRSGHGCPLAVRVSGRASQTGAPRGRGWFTASRRGRRTRDAVVPAHLLRRHMSERNTLAHAMHDLGSPPGSAAR